MQRFLLAVSVTLYLFALAGCSQGAVIFAPTAIPPDFSPLRYQHPGGAFSVEIPRQWAVYAQNALTLASASFTPADGRYPAITISVIRLSAPPPLTDLITQYQAIRPDAGSYDEQTRQPMGDGSWRITELRRSAGDLPQQVNTFVDLQGDLLAIIETRLDPDNRARLIELETIINTLQLSPAAPLEASSLETLSAVDTSDLEILNVATWRTPEGVFFITGEVLNHSSQTIGQVPLRVELQRLDGSGIAEALDLTMGYGLTPGGFAPFSLRFGQGRPEEAVQYRLTLGGADWQPTAATIRSGDAMTWTDADSYTTEGQFVIEGTLTVTGQQPIRDPLATVTLFDADQNVIAAAFLPVASGTLQPGETIPFRVLLAEYGAEIANYIVNVQALES